MTKQKTVVAGALGECVHVAGVTNFLRLAESAGWRTIFLGPSVTIDEMIRVAKREKADMVGVSYRLTPETGERLLGEFAEAASELHEKGVRFAFGGTPPVVERVRKIGFFEQAFDGSEPSEAIIAYLKGQQAQSRSEADFPQSTIERINWKSPYPILRHHFGLPTMEDTIAGIEKIADAQALDVISLGIDQDAQENFFHPERQEARQTGAGGVPVRTADDYRTLYEASRRGNFPMLRTYSGTDDFIKLAEMYVDTINIAWCAIPLFWFNQMDGRGPWDLEGSIREHQKVMQWYGERNIPVELNEPHHWGMRDSSDVTFVVAAYLSAYNARAFGVKDYIAQLMFNSPPGLSDAMDLAKMLAVMDMVEPLQHDNFKVWKQSRIGLLSHPLDTDAARGHLAASTYLQMALKPHIYHIVGHTEADHAATADDVIEASKIVRRAIENAVRGAPDMTADKAITKRRKELVKDANLLLEAISALAGPEAGDPLTDAATLTRAVTAGLMDAPQLRNNKFGRGEVRTRIVNGASVAVDLKGKPLTETRRLSTLK
ncbi:MAG TPA: cobalamin B12-binding domain-containing protein [Anaerolineales bacterium]|nr:cobalamin B12-binding domain-containing protein [Anaerolineales bacterium]